MYFTSMGFSVFDLDNNQKKIVGITLIAFASLILVIEALTIVYELLKLIKDFYNFKKNETKYSFYEQFKNDGDDDKDKS